MINYNKLNDFYESNNKDKLKLEISNIDSNDKEKESIINQFLIIYTYEGDIDMMDFLISQGASIYIVENKDIEDKEKTYILSYDLLAISVMTGNIDVIKYLLDKGLDINTINNKISLLHIALNKKQTEVFKFLIDNGAEMSMPNMPSIFNIAIANKQLEEAYYILDKGFDFDFERDKQTDPLILTLGMKDNNAYPDWTHPMVERIMDKGYTFKNSMVNNIQPLEEFSVSNKLPLYMYKKIVSKMAKDIDLNYEVINQMPAIHKMIESGNEEFLKVLLDHGVDIEKKVNYNDFEEYSASQFMTGMTPLRHAVNIGKVNIVEFLLKRGANVNSSPLLKIGMVGNKKVFPLLLKYGADLNENLINDKADEESIKAIHIVSQEYEEDILEDIISRGADVNETTVNMSSLIDDSTPIMFAAGNGRKKNIEVLLKNGADINFTNKYGYNAAAKLILNNHLNVFDNGFDLVSQIVNGEYTQPKENKVLMLENRNKAKMELLKFLVEKGANLDITINGTHIIKILNASNIDNKEEIKEYIKKEVYPKKSLLFKMLNK